MFFQFIYKNFLLIVPDFKRKTGKSHSDPSNLCFLTKNNGFNIFKYVVKRLYLVVNVYVLNF